MFFKAEKILNATGGDLPEGILSWIIGGIIIGNDAMIAVGDTVIEPYDRVAIFAMPESIREIDSFFK